MKHFGDITKLSGYALPVVDVITGGSPCQDLSVAGKRAGLDGERSGLFMEQVRITKEMREHDRSNGRTGDLVRPRYLVWENVPGAFSSNGGKDFQAVLTEIAKIAEPECPDVPLPKNGKWSKSGALFGVGANGCPFSIAWRVHDAQFWGVPQRRKRIALVADFGGLSAPEILFERKGLSGDIEPCGETGQETAGAVGDGTEGASSGVVAKGNGDCFLTPERHTSLTAGGGQAGQGYPCVLDERGASCYGKGWREDQCYTLNTIDRPAVMAFAQNQVGEVRVSSMSGTLNTNSNATGRNSPLVYDARGNGNGVLPFDTTQITSPQNGNHPHYGDPCHPLAAGAHPPAIAIRGEQQPVVAFTQNQRNEVRDLGDMAGALAAEPGVHQQTYVYENHSQDSRFRPLGDICQTVSATYGMGGNNQPLVVSGTYQAVTGDHQNRVTDYTALCVGNGQANQSVSDKAGALNTMHDQQAVLIAMASTAAHAEITTDGVSPSLLARAGTGGNNMPNITRGSTVRRLTPLECERLQGYPDGWTDIGEWVDSNGKKHGEADSPRYKALGNSIALPFWQWMARRICAQYERPVTMASLFDGIGGFPLVFSRCGATPVWASEIEEFPIAVTKVRFPEEE